MWHLISYYRRRMGAFLEGLENTKRAITWLLELRVIFWDPSANLVAHGRACAQFSKIPMSGMDGGCAILVIDSSMENQFSTRCLF